MKPFSSLKYFSRNKKRAATVFAVLLLSVAVVSFLTSLVSSIIIDANKANLEQFNYMSYISPTASDVFLKDSVVSEIEEIGSIEKTYSVSVENTSFNSLIGNTSSFVITPYETSDIPHIMEKMGLKLSGGRLPEVGNEFEIVMNERLLQNKGLEIGGEIGNDLDDNEWLSGKYKIVGSMSGTAIVSFSNKNMRVESLKQTGLVIEKPMSMLLIPKSGQLLQMNERLDQIDHKDASVMTYSSLQKMFDEQIASLDVILFIIIFTVVLVISISISAMIYIVYLSRNEEFGILYAMGYRKSFIRNLVLKEIASLSVSCWAAGYGFSYLIFMAVNHFILAPKGQALYFFTLSGLINTLIVPVLVIICAVVPILRKLKKWDPIAVIERRE
jgi:putative ABC transport system permease protein